MRHRRGNAMVETAMFLPLFVILLMGMAEIAKVTYIYYSAHKALYNIARMVGTRNGVNLCDEGDAELVSIKNFALTGNSEGGTAIVHGLTPEIVQVRIERQESGSDILGECECSLEGCDPSQGGRPPDFVVVEVPDGFQVSVTLPYLIQEVIVFRPTVRVPNGAAS
jgi:hypothetical protein